MEGKNLMQILRDCFPKRKQEQVEERIYRLGKMPEKKLVLQEARVEALESRASYLKNKRGHFSPYFFGYMVGMLIGIFIMDGGIGMKAPANTNSLYVNPRNVTFRVQDIDQDKKNETVLEYKGKKYTLEFRDERVFLTPYLQEELK